MLVRTRFAPSPTGYLHVGSVRTALYCWLYARRHHGQYILRIEDTDLERSTQEAVDVIMTGLDWLGLEQNEGPYFQTKRMPRYEQVLGEWLESGKAYKCYCHKDRLEKLREAQEAEKEKPRYDRYCLHHAPASPDAPFVIRFKNPQEGVVAFEDEVLGYIEFQNNELDDLIIARTDGMPTYNFTVVVDDYDMQVTHVIRGNDHVNNTPRQINMLKAMGAQPPVYAHLPMILGEDGKRLSKRHGAVSVLNYREEGYLPQALLNYLVRLGWSHGDQEIFTLDEMTAFFDIDNINKSPSMFDKEKLQWVNQHYIKTLPVEIIKNELEWQFDYLGIDKENGPDLGLLIDSQRDRFKTLQEMAHQSRHFYQDNINYYNNAEVEKILNPQSVEILTLLQDNLKNVTEWEKENLHQAILATGEMLNLKLGKFGPQIRVAVTGETKSPSLDLTLFLLGKKRTLERLEKAIKFAER